MTDRTKKYFLDLFHSASLSGAVEAAAASLLAPTLRGFDPWSELPVRLEPVLEDRQIRLGDELTESICGEGRLVASESGFIAHIKQSRSPGRRRFSIAHEIAHTLFYKDSGGGQRHQVGAMTVAEHSSEEAICNRVAGALLVPSKYVRGELGKASVDDISAFLWLLDRVAAKLQVSVAALIARLPHVQLPSRTLSLVTLQFSTNRSTGEEEKLRVVFSHSLTYNPNSPTLWPNVSATTVRLAPALRLFDLWAAEASTTSGTRAAGRFALDNSQDLLRVGKATDIATFDARIVSWARTGRGWVTQPQQVVCAPVLYAPPNGALRDARVVVAIRYSEQH